MVILYRIILNTHVCRSYVKIRGISMFVYDKGLKPKRRQYMIMFVFIVSGVHFQRTHRNIFGRLENFHLSLQKRRERYILIHARKMANNLTPNDIKMIFKKNARNGLKAIVPPLLGVNKTTEPSPTIIELN